MSNKQHSTSIIFNPFILIIICLSLISVTACQISDYSIEKKISESDITRFQNNWSQSIIGIGSAYKSGRDYKSLATSHIENFYAFDHSKVILRHTKDDISTIKTTFEGTLDFLISNNPDSNNLTGFALKPWKDIQWQTAGIINETGKVALAMGHYTFTDNEGITTEFDYTLSLERNKEDKIMIIAYDIKESCDNEIK